jgi:dTMP kinase
MKFAVIEGIDGSGKSTQISMLQDYLKEKKIQYKYLHFPRMETGIYGELVARFLRGELGSIEQVNPYLVALIYAGDRMDAANMIQSWISEGNLIIVDRYVFSNIAYQCAKLNNDQEKEKLKNWILNLEYNYNKIPKPDINIFFDVPFQFTKERLTRTREGDDRSYLQGSTDIHEADIDFQARVRETYINLAKTEQSLKLINCSDNDRMMKPQEIFKLVISNLEAAGVV